MRASFLSTRKLEAEALFYVQSYCCQCVSPLNTNKVIKMTTTKFWAVAIVPSTVILLLQSNFLVHSSPLTGRAPSSTELKLNFFPDSGNVAASVPVKSDDSEQTISGRANVHSENDNKKNDEVVNKKSTDFLNAIQNRFQARDPEGSEVLMHSNEAEEEYGEDWPNQLNSRLNLREKEKKNADPVVSQITIDSKTESVPDAKADNGAQLDSSDLFEDDSSGSGSGSNDNKASGSDNTASNSNNNSNDNNNHTNSYGTSSTTGSYDNYKSSSTTNSYGHTDSYGSSTTNSYGHTDSYGSSSHDSYGSGSSSNSYHGDTNNHGYGSSSGGGYDSNSGSYGHSNSYGGGGDGGGHGGGYGGGHGGGHHHKIDKSKVFLINRVGVPSPPDAPNTNFLFVDAFPRPPRIPLPQVNVFQPEIQKNHGHDDHIGCGGGGFGGGGFGGGGFGGGGFGGGGFGGGGGFDGGGGFGGGLVGRGGGGGGYGGDFGGDNICPPPSGVYGNGGGGGGGGDGGGGYGGGGYGGGGDGGFGGGGGGYGGNGGGGGYNGYGGNSNNDGYGSPPSSYGSDQSGSSSYGDSNNHGSAGSTSNGYGGESSGGDYSSRAALPQQGVDLTITSGQASPNVQSTVIDIKPAPADASAAQ